MSLNNMSLEAFKITTKKTNNACSVPLSMQLSGELAKNHIIVHRAKDVGRLYNKSHFGKTLTGNILQLDLLEGVFLLGEQKIRIVHGKKTVSFQELVMRASQLIPSFEMKYLLFKDLRNKGHSIPRCEHENPTTFQKAASTQEQNTTDVFIMAFSERDIFSIEQTKQLASSIKKRKADLWYGIVDEEGDITYYEISVLAPKGKIHAHAFAKGSGLLLENRLVLFENKLSEDLLEKEFFGKPFGDGLQLSLVEALYLAKNGTITIHDLEGEKISLKNFEESIGQGQPDIDQRLAVFTDLKKRGLLVKTGFKFGAHFRAYTQQPEKTHAEYLIHVVKQSFRSTWAEMSRAVRLAHSVNKEILFAQVDGEEITYIKIGRLRP